MQLSPSQSLAWPLACIPEAQVRSRIAGDFLSPSSRTSNDHIVLILMYRRTSFMDITKTYPAKISPAVPRTFRTTLNVLIAPTFCPNWHPALMLSAPSRKCFSRRSRFRQTTSTHPGLGPILHSVEEVAATLLPLTRAGEIGKAKYRASKNRQGFNRARSALSD